MARSAWMILRGLGWKLYSISCCPKVWTKSQQHHTVTHYTLGMAYARINTSIFHGGLAWLHVGHFRHHFHDPEPERDDWDNEQPQDLTPRSKHFPLTSTLSPPNPCDASYFSDNSTPTPRCSTPSPLGKPLPPDLVYMTNALNLNLPQSLKMSRLELLTQALTHRAMSDRTQNLGGQSFMPSSMPDPTIIGALAPFPSFSLSGKPGHYYNNCNTVSNQANTNGGTSTLLYNCNRCGKSYGVRRSLHRHQKFECGVEPKFCCPVCQKRCTHKFNLKQHMLSHHKYVVS
ncbi:uncharacterized protein LOC143036650 [Oratosquilla oratoria]|uniref:uncharacterized protein LOC143036650 n=1 Tax=Oratosquilla oratoria TaxID=337810 RepID=UPI003F75EB46